MVLINNQFANLSDFINLSFDQPSSSAFSQTLWRLYELSVLHGRIDLHFFCRSVLQYKSVLNWTLLTVKVYETDFNLWVYKCKYMCLKWTNGSNECSKSATDKMYIQCKVKAPCILLVQNVIKIIENTVQLLIFILKINRRSEKTPRRCISIKWLSFILQSCLVS